MLRLTRYVEHDPVTAFRGRHVVIGGWHVAAACNLETATVESISPSTNTVCASHSSLAHCLLQHGVTNYAAHTPKHTSIQAINKPAQRCLASHQASAAAVACFERTHTTIKKLPAQTGSSTNQPQRLTPRSNTNNRQGGVYGAVSSKHPSNQTTMPHIHTHKPLNGGAMGLLAQADCCWWL